MKIIDWIKGVLSKLIGTDNIKAATGGSVAITDSMQVKIDEWYSQYIGKADWVTDTVKSQRYEVSICRDFADVALSEMQVKITDDRLQAIIDNLKADLHTHLQLGLATGGLIVKPLSADKVQFITANNYVPLEYDSRGRLISVVFPDCKKLGNTYYTRLETHRLGADGLTITNKVYRSNNSSTLGIECALTEVTEWANLLPYINYPTMTHPAYGYYKNPLPNDIDGSHTPISIYSPAVEHIKKADMQAARIEWEFESGERAIYVDDAAVKRDGSIAKNNKRLYRGLNIDIDGNGLFETFSPELRQADLIAGLENYKKAIELSVGLSFGDLSDPTTVAKTATEIKASKQRKYNMVNAIQSSLKDCIEDLVYSLAFYNGLVTSGYDISVTFSDSILTDEETERAQDRLDVSMGVMSAAEYRSKWYGEPLEVAQSKVTSTVLPADNDSGGW